MNFIDLKKLLFFFSKLTKGPTTCFYNHGAHHMFCTIMGSTFGGQTVPTTRGRPTQGQMNSSNASLVRVKSVDLVRVTLAPFSGLGPIIRKSQMSAPWECPPLVLATRAPIPQKRGKTYNNTVRANRIFRNPNWSHTNYEEERESERENQMDLKGLSEISGDLGFFEEKNGVRLGYKKSEFCLG